MLLAIDMGNTQTALGLFDGGELVHSWRMPTDRSFTADELHVRLHGYFHMYGMDLDVVDAMAFAGVVPQLNRAWRRVAERLGAPIAMHRADVALLEDNDQQPLQAHCRLGKFLLGLSRKGFRDTLLPPFHPDLFLEDGDDLSPFGVQAQVVALPGHTAGSIGLKTEDGALLVGDAMVHIVSVAPALVYADRRQMEDSVSKIWALHPTVLYFGHGRPAQGL